jgi:hypothetical protein
LESTPQGGAEKEHRTTRCSGGLWKEEIANWSENDGGGGAAERRLKAERKNSPENLGHPKETRRKLDSGVAADRLYRKRRGDERLATRSRIAAVGGLTCFPPMNLVIDHGKAPPWNSR